MWCCYTVWLTTNGNGDNNDDDDDDDDDSNFDYILARLSGSIKLSGDD